MNRNLKKVVFVAAAVLLIVIAAIIVGFQAGVYAQKRFPERPAICDRTGIVLLKDRGLFPFSIRKTRHAEYGGKFASGLLGHTVVEDGKRKGALGVESLIDAKGITSPEVYLTMDARIQEKCESLLDRLVAVRVPKYTYITVLDSYGNLIASAQRPAMDLNDRSSIRDSQELIFMTMGYVFPVSDDWMRLLGSSSFAEPEEKARYRFHLKSGVFPVESAGVISGLKHPDWQHDDSQFATVPGYLLAFIGGLEGKEIPELKILLPEAAPWSALKATGDIQWISLLWSRDRSTLSALGMVPSEFGRSLYLMLRLAYDKDDENNGKPETDELLEKTVRSLELPRSARTEDAGATTE